MTIDGYFAVEGEAREAWLGELGAEALLQLGIDLYNAGHFWNAHEAWEEVWLESERGVRAFYQGLIQVAAGFVHVTRGRYPGSVKLLGDGIAKLERYEPAYLGVDVASLVAGARSCRERLLELGESRVREFDVGLIPRIEGAGSEEPETG
jgi:predicted metal-dependent hydrolase